MFPTETQIIAAAIETMTTVAAGQGFEPDGCCCAYFASSAPGIVPPTVVWSTATSVAPELQRPPVSASTCVPCQFDVSYYEE